MTHVKTSDTETVQMIYLDSISSQLNTLSQLISNKSSYMPATSAVDILDETIRYITKRQNQIKELEEKLEKKEVLHSREAMTFKQIIMTSASSVNLKQLSHLFIDKSYLLDILVEMNLIYKDMPQERPFKYNAVQHGFISKMYSTLPMSITKDYKWIEHLDHIWVKQFIAVAVLYFANANYLTEKAIDLFTDFKLTKNNAYITMLDCSGMEYANRYK